MSERKLERWQPCSRKCELAGSASFILSLKDSVLLMNGPRWCANLAASFVSRLGRGVGDRIFCTEVGQSDMVFGTGQLVVDSLADIEKAYTPKVVGVLNSCSVSLIGDDIRGICESHSKNRCHYLCMDSGGLRGEFYEGFQEAMVQFIEEIPFPQGIPKEPRRVNLIGWCMAYPGWEADLVEIRRLLEAAGLTVGAVLGADALTVENAAAELPRAVYNLVLYPELGLSAAKRLQEKTGTPYVVCPVPYGWEGSLSWLKQVAETVGTVADLSSLEEEIKEARYQLNQALAGGRPSFSTVYAALPQGVARGLLPALQKEGFPFQRLYLRLDGPGKVALDDPRVHPWPFYETPAAGEGRSLVLGNTFTRLEVGNPQAVYLNLLSPTSGLWPRNKGYAGIRGWEFFLADVLEQTG